MMYLQSLSCATKVCAFASGREIVLLCLQYVLMPGGPIPGECLPLNGSKGFIDIKLRSAIVPTALTYEHVPTSIAYDIRSAPQDMSVVGPFCLPSQNPL